LKLGLAFLSIIFIGWLFAAMVASVVQDLFGLSDDAAQALIDVLGIPVGCLAGVAIVKYLWEGK
jgi:hypothetical protein